MNSRQLAKRSSSSTNGILLTTVFWLGFIAFVQAYISYAAYTCLIAGTYDWAFVSLLFSLLFLWTSGSLYVCLPLNLYFHRQYRTERNFAKVDMVHRKALQALKKLPFRRHPAVVSTISNLGLLRLCQGHFESAEALFLEAEAYLLKDKRFRTSDSMLVVLNNLAVAKIRQNKLVEAHLIAEKAQEVCESPSLRLKRKMLAAAPLGLNAAISLRLGEYEESISFAEKALQIYENEEPLKGFPPDTFNQAKIFCLIGMAYCQIKLARESESLLSYNKAMDLMKNHPSNLNTLCLEPLYMLASQYLENGILDKAEELLELSYQIGMDEPFHPDSQKILGCYEKLLSTTNRQAEISDMRSWLRPLDCRLIS
ncbi:MAG: hypothetical protein K2X27_16710 [Candidatus Obscuribacterales bacterium]|nr:hypothetical protein [Candidatus Obscuribacterales bacterium]